MSTYLEYVYTNPSSGHVPSPWTHPPRSHSRHTEKPDLLVVFSDPTVTLSVKDHKYSGGSTPLLPPIFHFHAVFEKIWSNNRLISIPLCATPGGVSRWVCVQEGKSTGVCVCPGGCVSRGCPGGICPGECTPPSPVDRILDTRL